MKIFFIIRKGEIVNKIRSDLRICTTEPLPPVKYSEEETTKDFKLENTEEQKQKIVDASYGNGYVVVKYDHRVIKVKRPKPQKIKNLLYDVFGSIFVVIIVIILCAVLFGGLIAAFVDSFTKLKEAWESSDLWIIILEGGLCIFLIGIFIYFLIDVIRDL